MFAKLIDGNLVPPNNPEIYESQQWFNPPAEVLTALDYFPVIDTPMPEDEPEEGYEWTSHYEQNGAAIERVWELTLIPEPPIPQPTPEDRLSQLEEANAQLLEMLAALLDGRVE